MTRDSNGYLATSEELHGSETRGRPWLPRWSGWGRPSVQPSMTTKQTNGLMVTMLPWRLLLCDHLRDRGQEPDEWASWTCFILIGLERTISLSSVGSFSLRAPCLGPSKTTARSCRPSAWASSCMSRNASIDSAPWPSVSKITASTDDSRNGSAAVSASDTRRGQYPQLVSPLRASWISDWDSTHKTFLGTTALTSKACSSPCAGRSPRAGRSRRGPAPVQQRRRSSWDLLPRARQSTVGRGRSTRSSARIARGRRPRRPCSDTRAFKLIFIIFSMIRPSSSSGA